MDWTEKIEKAMKDLANACKENRNYAECYKCPFARYCDIVLGVCDISPEDWFNDDKEEE